MNSSSHVPFPSALAEHTRWLVLKEDPFSRQISLASDAKFWWRMEVSDTAQARITDFNPGAQDDAVMAASLEMLLRQVMPNKVTFVDLVPAQLEPNAHRLALNNAAQRVQAWTAAAGNGTWARGGQHIIGTRARQSLFGGHIALGRGVGFGSIEIIQDGLVGEFA